MHSVSVTTGGDFHRSSLRHNVDCNGRLLSMNAAPDIRHPLSYINRPLSTLDDRRGSRSSGSKAVSRNLFVVGLVLSHPGRPFPSSFPFSFLSPPRSGPTNPAKGFGGALLAHSRSLSAGKTTFATTRKTPNTPKKWLRPSSTQTRFWCI